MAKRQFEAVARIIHMESIAENSWIQTPYEKSAAELLYKSLNIGFPLCVMLAQRGITSKMDAEKFLWPKIIHLDDPFKIKNIDRAVNILTNVIENHLNVAIVGDYDVDGITSITLLINVLKTFGINPDFFVPRRASEGYGLSSEIIERLLSEKKYDLVATLDCGTNSAEEVGFLQKNGIEVLIVDHHQAQILPAAKCCIINPHIGENKDDDKYKTLCTVGLVFKLCSALLKNLAKKNNQLAINYPLKNDLDLATLGTIADMMHLVGENRILCKFGLKIINGRFRRPGLEALCKSADIHSGSNIRQSDVSFKLCPRLNACGRLRDAVLPIKMMLSDNLDEAMTYAYELDETNRERQLIEKEITRQAAEIVKMYYTNDSAIVLYNENWHAGVVGIISGKFARDYSRPCIVLGNEREMAKGSGRSTNGLNLIDILSDCSSLLEVWGGHPYAVGVSILPKNIDEFRTKFNAVVEKSLGKVSQQIKFEYAYELELEAIDNSLMDELEMLQPFGQKNPEPIFLLKNIRISNLPESFGAQKNHVKFWLTDKYSKRMLAIGWNSASNIPPINTPLDLLVTVNRETWNKIHSTCLYMTNWRMAVRQ
ncbi:MAG: single-stranded-DNA-specific exonuclease RecJ [Puniceicoccales bacterium]|jgi:single-stranded-DNA-specific exonuclease|nr:single-stranded-DNA-specific exonuclease RecJ [Puniceicoccales bacterium]